MHQTLRLRSPYIEHSPSCPQNLQNVRILLTHITYPSHKSSIMIAVFYPHMLFDADWDTMQRTDRFSICFYVIIEVCGAFKGSFEEDFRHTVRLLACYR